jgi:hypothetical protein
MGFRRSSVRIAPPRPLSHARMRPFGPPEGLSFSRTDPRSDPRRVVERRKDREIERCDEDRLARATAGLDPDTGRPRRPDGSRAFAYRSVAGRVVAELPDLMDAWTGGREHPRPGGRPRRPCSTEPSGLARCIRAIDPNEEPLVRVRRARRRSLPSSRRVGVRRRWWPRAAGRPCSEGRRTW